MKVLVLLSFLAMPFMAMGESWLFSGKDYSGINLDGRDFSGQDLYGADFRGSSLRGANFDGADLRNADFDGANLSCANLRGAKLFDGLRQPHFIQVNKASFEKAYMDSELWHYLLDHINIEFIGEIYGTDDNCDSQQQ